jgi:hypothetical protein
MADNFTANPGIGGDTFAADDVGGVKVPYSKLDIGADGVSSPVTTANPLPAAMYVIRDDSSAAPVANGQIHVATSNERGRLKVSAEPAEIANTTGAITASTQTVFCDTSRVSNLAISMNTSALAGHNVTFEASNNSTNGTDGNWYAVQVVRSNANTVETTSGVLASTPVYMWQVNVADYKWFRVRATAHTSGTANYVFAPGAYASEPVPASQVTGTQPVSGSLTSAGTVTPIPSTAQGSSTHHHAISAASTNATSVKTSAGVVNCITLSNDAASKRYFKLYNKASAPTVGTDTPIMTIVMPPGDTRVIDCGAFGIRLATGIAYAITGGIAVSDTAAIGASETAVHIDYT